jgi:hypothetical protein
MNGHDPLCSVARETWCIWPGDKCRYCRLIAKTTEAMRKACIAAVEGLPNVTPDDLTYQEVLAALKEVQP